MKTSALLTGLGGLAGLVLSLGACHTNGAYLSGNGFKPKGPGVVDCGWYDRDDEGDTYVEHYCAPSRAAEIAYMAQQRFPVTTQIETKWNGIEIDCGEGCVRTAPAVVVASGPGTPGYGPPGLSVSAMVARVAIAAPATGADLPPSGPYEAAAGPRPRADDQDNLPPPKPGAPLAIPAKK